MKWVDEQTLRDMVREEIAAHEKQRENNIRGEQQETRIHELETENELLRKRAEEADRLVDSWRAESYDSDVEGMRWKDRAEAAEKRAEAAEKRLAELHDRLQTVADEAFGPFPTEPSDKLITLIEKGVFEQQKRLSELESGIEVPTTLDAVEPAKPMSDVEIVLRGIEAAGLKAMRIGREWHLRRHVDRKGLVSISYQRGWITEWLDKHAPNGETK